MGEYRWTATILNTIMFLTPLTEVVQVCRLRDSSRIYLPWTIVGLVCAGAWSAYGFAISSVSERMSSKPLPPARRGDSKPLARMTLCSGAYSAAERGGSH
jgi:uncharacterized protein with PQ loop repeat